VYDPFVGSGSSLLAAEQEGRVGFGMEISPGYCDVILDRWERHGGATPTKVE
jgi:DNA modification methylase